MAQPSMPRRANGGFLQPLERPALYWLALRMPAWVTPDRLTAFAFIGAATTAAGYVLARWHPAFLWLATAGLMVNWFGDSLDGTIARFRNIERPRYGFFLDQNLDALAQLLIAAGIGFSGFIRFELAILALAIYFLLTIFSLVNAVVSNVFALTYSGFGLTEIRVSISILNAIMFFFPPTPFQFAGLSLSYPEALAILWIVSMLIIFVIETRHQLRHLSAEEQVTGRPGRIALPVQSAGKNCSHRSNSRIARSKPSSSEVSPSEQ
jgi:archaetidylinositol phosphate synthase